MQWYIFAKILENKELIIRMEMMLFLRIIHISRIKHLTGSKKYIMTKIKKMSNKMTKVLWVLCSIKLYQNNVCSHEKRKGKNRLLIYFVSLPLECVWRVNGNHTQCQATYYIFYFWILCNSLLPHIVLFVISL